MSDNTISVEEFDRTFDDGEDISAYVDWSSASTGPEGAARQSGFPRVDGSESGPPGTEARRGAAGADPDVAGGSAGGGKVTSVANHPSECRSADRSSDPHRDSSSD
jgi:hypothetical protein